MLAWLFIPGAVFAVIGYIWLCVLIVRELEAGIIILGVLLLGAFTLISVLFAWYFSMKRWDIAKRPFLVHALGLLLMVVGFMAIVNQSSPQLAEGLRRGAAEFARSAS